MGWSNSNRRPEWKAREVCSLDATTWGALIPHIPEMIRHRNAAIHDHTPLDELRDDRDTDPWIGPRIILYRLLEAGLDASKGPWALCEVCGAPCTAGGGKEQLRLSSGEVVNSGAYECEVCGWVEQPEIEHDDEPWHDDGPLSDFELFGSGNDW